jgi:hypothetical protein
MNKQGYIGIALSYRDPLLPASRSWTTAGTITMAAARSAWGKPFGAGGLRAGLMDREGVEARKVASPEPFFDLSLDGVNRFGDRDFFGTDARAFEMAYATPGAVGMVDLLQPFQGLLIP